MSMSGFYREKTTNNRIRLDVDGTYPQHCASGLIYFHQQNGALDYMYWFARVQWNDGRRSGHGVVEHVFWNQSESGAWYANVDIEVVEGNPRQMKVSWTGGGHPALNATYEFSSDFFQEANIEFDYQTGYAPVKSIHPTEVKPANPQDFPDTLTLEQVFLQSGIKVYSTGGDNEVQVSVPGKAPKDKVWTSAELHDRMAVNFSLYGKQPAVMSLWVFATTLVYENDDGVHPAPSVGGRMFDFGRANKDGRPRQGSVLCYESVMMKLDTPTLTNWIRFVSTIHEIGHCFNLAHSFEKTTGTPWLRGAVQGSANDLSFMNYAYSYDSYVDPRTKIANFPGSFLRRFRHRFSDSELYFLRHAPKWFMRMGDTDSREFGDHHGLVSIPPGQGHEQLSLELACPGGTTTFEFLEPISLDLRLSNHGTQPVGVDSRWLRDPHRTALFVARDGGPTRRWTPFSTDCYLPQPEPLAPGASLSAELPVWFGTGGPLTADPGSYTVYATMVVDGQPMSSRPVRFRVLSPADREEERVAQDFFQPEVARVLHFGGTHALGPVNDVLRNLDERFGPRGLLAAAHARRALLLPHTYGFHRTEVGPDGVVTGRHTDPDPQAIEQWLTLHSQAPAVVLRSLGARSVERTSEQLKTRLAGLR